MNFFFIYFLLIKFTKQFSDQNTNQNEADFHYIPLNFRALKKINRFFLFKKYFLKESTEFKTLKTEIKNKLPMIPKNDNSTNNDNKNNGNDEKKDPTLFQKLMKAISTLLIVFLIVFIIFIIIYLIIVKSGIKTNFNFTRQLNRLGFIGNDNEESSNELDIKAILGEVKTSDSESMQMDENEDINDQNDDYNQNDTEINKNNDNIETINESS